MSTLVSRDADDRWHFQLVNELAELAAFGEQVRGCLDQAARPAPLPAAARATILLLFDEMLTNVIKYAFPDGGRHEIDAWLSLRPDGFEIEVVDDGIPFDPTHGEDPTAGLPPSPADALAALDERPLGGLGLHLVRCSVDQIRYQRDRRRNRVTLRKSLAAPPSSHAVGPGRVDAAPGSRPPG